MSPIWGWRTTCILTATSVTKSCGDSAPEANKNCHIKTLGSYTLIKTNYFLSLALPKEWLHIQINFSDIKKNKQTKPQHDNSETGKILQGL